MHFRPIYAVQNWYLTLHRSIHLTPWPVGVTHPGNLHPLCREHHLVKTFRTGPGGWTAIATPDGTIRWTAPTGHTYTKAPGGAILFPQWNIETTVPRVRSTSLAGTNRDAMMPTRRRTRTQDRAQRIKTERDRNTAELAGGGSDPPPF